jgi:hypothetical protein
MWKNGGITWASHVFAIEHIPVFVFLETVQSRPTPHLSLLLGK